jgi:hypothetical protein
MPLLIKGIHRKNTKNLRLINIRKQSTQLTN